MPTTLRASFALVLFLLASMAMAQPKESGPFRVGGEVSRPEKISGESPDYTEMARKARISGVVIVEAVIDENGDVTETKVLKGLPMGLDQAAVEALETWKFRPATMDGRPVPVYYIVTLNFQLDAGLSFGPRFGQLMLDNPELGELVRGKSYEKALDWLANRPDSQEGRLARAYLLLGLGRIPEAWEVARALDDPEHVLLSSFSDATRDAAIEEEDVERRAEILDAGIQALTRAMELKKDDYWAISGKSWLLRERAKLAGGEEERKALIEEANRLTEQASRSRTKPWPPDGSPP